MKFVQDGPEAPTQIRQCGVPVQHRLSDAMGEAVLFCLDFAVNKSTESNMYRLLDDIYVARFILNIFGESTNCLGRPPLAMVIEAFQKIQRGLFADIDLPGDNMGESLKVELAGRFGVDNILEGFFYFPIDLGGLGIRNPLIPLLLVRRESSRDPLVKFGEAFELEEADHYKAKKGRMRMEPWRMAPRFRGPSMRIQMMTSDLYPLMNIVDIAKKQAYICVRRTLISLCPHGARSWKRPQIYPTLSRY